MQNDFHAMILSFGETVTIYRRAAGAYTNGVWIEGSESTFTTSASIQPASGKALAFLQEGQRTGEELVGYFTNELNTSAAITGKNTDILLWRGARYKILTVRRWLPTQIYWECILTKETEV